MMTPFPLLPFAPVVDGHRRECSLTDPYMEIKGGSWFHPSSECISWSDYYDRYRCKVCGLEFKVEVGI